jgi:L-ascorbate metabolism protein UlaG (beta-lactamase superfamily)
VSIFAVMREFFFEKKPRKRPIAAIPSKKTDLSGLDPQENVLVWFGHSSCFIQVNGKKILVDPVLSGAASPVSFTTRSFKGSDIYTPANIPEIDLLLLSHDHWDHLDHKTLVQLRHRIGRVICGLGVGEHLERWGYDPARIVEEDWDKTLSPFDDFTIHTTTARHFSGRGLRRNQSLWMSFVLQTPSYRIFIGGDSGYDSHFADIGHKYGPFDLAILENGQYDKSWKYIHMMPDEVVRAAK